MHWLARWLCDSQVTGSIPVGDSQGDELFGEIAPKTRRFYLLLFLFIIYLSIISFYYVFIITYFIMYLLLHTLFIIIIYFIMY